MPQIYVILGPGTQALYTETEAADLGRRLIPLVEKAFGIEGHKDVAFTAVRAMETDGEADVQVEIRYTVGRDEYGGGRPFNPTMRQQEKLSALIAEEFRVFLEAHGLRADDTLSVWCKPYRGSFFKMYQKGERKRK